MGRRHWQVSTWRNAPVIIDDLSVVQNGKIGLENRLKVKALPKERFSEATHILTECTKIGRDIQTETVTLCTETGVKVGASAADDVWEDISQSPVR